MFAKPDNWSAEDAEKLAADAELVCQTVGDHVVLGHPKTIGRIASNPSGHSSQAVSSAFAQCATAPLQVILVLSPNQRRVISEIGVPEKLRQSRLDANLLAEIRWAAISISLEDQGSAQMIVNTKDADTAQQVWECLPEMIPVMLAHQTLDRIESLPEQVHAQLRITKGSLLEILQGAVRALDDHRG